MKITIGSGNEIKINALKEIIKDYDFLRGARVSSKKVSSDVADQPKSLEETIKGAMNRAKNAYNACDFSIGLESGLMKIPFTKTGYMDVTACAIYDGKEFHLGLSSAFEYPKEMTRMVLEKGLDIDQAAYSIGLTKSKRIGSSEGVVGLLTKGRLLRKEYTKQAITTALIHLEHAYLWKD